MWGPVANCGDPLNLNYLRNVGTGGELWGRAKLELFVKCGDRLRIVGTGGSAKFELIAKWAERLRTVGTCVDKLNLNYLRHVGISGELWGPVGIG